VVWLLVDAIVVADAFFIAVVAAPLNGTWVDVPFAKLPLPTVDKVIAIVVADTFDVDGGPEAKIAGTAAIVDPFPLGVEPLDAIVVPDTFDAGVLKAAMVDPFPIDGAWDAATVVPFDPAMVVDMFELAIVVPFWNTNGVPTLANVVVILPIDVVPETETVVPFPTNGVTDAATVVPFGAIVVAEKFDAGVADVKLAVVLTAAMVVPFPIDGATVVPFDEGGLTVDVIFELAIGVVPFCNANGVPTVANVVILPRVLLVSLPMVVVPFDGGPTVVPFPIDGAWEGATVVMFKPAIGVVPFCNANGVPTDANVVVILPTVALTALPMVVPFDGGSTVVPLPLGVPVTATVVPRVEIGAGAGGVAADPVQAATASRPLHLSLTRS